MAYIYTISHPFTNEIVYVGVTKNLPQRAKAHIAGNKHNSDLANWINELVSSYMLPKIECIDEVLDSDIFYFEEYWVHQIQSWGFKLFNKVKHIRLTKSKIKYAETKTGLKKRHIKKTPEQWASERQARFDRKQSEKLDRRNSRKWNILNFDIGREYIVAEENRRSFKEMFRQYAKKFNVERSLSETVIENGYKLIVTEQRQKKPTYGILPCGKKRYVQKTYIKLERRKRGEKFKWGFDKVIEGETVNVPFRRFATFVVSFNSYKKRHNLPLKLKYKYSDCNSYLIVTYVNENEIFKNPPVSASLVRNFGTGRNKKLNETQISEILVSDLSVRELAIKYDVSEATIYLIKKKNLNP